MAVSEVMYLSISSGEAPCFKVICQGSVLAGMMTRRLQLAACRRTHVVHGRHLEVPVCNGSTKGSAYFANDGYGICPSCLAFACLIDLV